MKIGQPHEIKTFLLANIEQHPHDIVTVCAQHFGVTRTTVHRHLNYLLKKNLITKTGTTKAISYHLRSHRHKTMRFKLTRQLEEFDIWQSAFSPMLNQAPSSVYDICEYGFTEMLNNAKDHSDGTWVDISLDWQNDHITIIMKDNGIGVFNKLQHFFNFNEVREGVLELSKGKVTTDPNNHTGEGIFFSSRAFDIFTIEANEISYTKNNVENDWFLQASHSRKKGTSITMEISSSATQDLKSLFLAYQNDDTLEFNKTEITVALSQLGSERYISRSQAKRIIRGLDKFEIIVFDFKGVITVGQGFVDEIFRVYQNQHPNARLKYINTNEDVLFMIKRGIVKK